MTPEAAITMRDHIVSNLENEGATLLRVLEAMPEGKLGYKPHERAMAFGELGFHIAGTGMFFSSMIEAGECPSGDGEAPSPDVPATTAALTEAVRGMLEGSVASFKRADGAALAREIEFMGMGKFPAVTFAEWHWVHLIHHRGQLTTYLRAAGEKVPAVYGPSADVSMEEMLAAGAQQ